MIFQPDTLSCDLAHSSWFYSEVAYTGDQFLLPALLSLSSGTCMQGAATLAAVESAFSSLELMTVHQAAALVHYHRVLRHHFAGLCYSFAAAVVGVQMVALLLHC